MVTFQDIEYPLRLCVELMYYAGLGAGGKTDNMRASEVKDAVRIFFTNEQIEKAQNILIGRS